MNIFISYRRTDCELVIGPIYDRLISRFPAGRVFRDLDSLPIGKPFPDALAEAIANAHVALIIIGPTWVSVSDLEGRRRLDNPADFVRLEVERALAANIPVVPVLVNRASMPNCEELPESLRTLVLRHGTQVRPDPDFHRDMDRLIGKLIALDGIESTVSSQSGEQPNGALSWRWHQHWLKAAMAFAVIACLTIFAMHARWPLAKDHSPASTLNSSMAKDLSYRLGSMTSFLYLLRSAGKKLDQTVLLAFHELCRQLTVDSKIYQDLLRSEDVSRESLFSAFTVTLVGEIRARHSDESAAAFETGYYTLTSLKLLQQEAEKTSVDGQFRAAAQQLLSRAAQYSIKARYSSDITESFHRAAQIIGTANRVVEVAEALTIVDNLNKKLAKHDATAE